MNYPDFNKYPDQLMPAIIQDSTTGKVLMLGYMNETAYEQTCAEGRVTFFSRSRQALWTKGDTSGNYLFVQEIKTDCDKDCLLVKVTPAGPVCHTGADTCFSEQNTPPFLQMLEQIIADRRDNPKEQSYVASLFQKGINKIAQKVGEEATELIIEAKDDDRDLFCNEAADLLFHYLVLLQARGVSLNEVTAVLQSRHQPGN